MDLDFTPEQHDFRAEVRTWLEDNAPKEPRPLDAAGRRRYDTDWQRRQWDGGWAGIAWPEEYGGRGLSTVQQLIWYEEYGRLGLPPIDACFVGLNHAGPTLMACGSEEQKAAHLPRILRGEATWCQGFSEPGAGSDLASLQLRAQIDGDDLVVNGQKIWTSWAEVADYQELLCRTDNSGKKHNGITWAICDMRSTGIEIRPITTMDGDNEFCEVFYDNVRIPLSNVVGDVDDGWRVAMSTLAFERGTAFTLSQVRLARTIEDLIVDCGRRLAPNGRPVIDDVEVARRLAYLRAEVASLRAMTYATISRSLRAGTPGPEGSMMKLEYAEIADRIYALAFEILGPAAMELVSRWRGGWSGYYLYSYSLSIAGGTSEIQRNIIGERVLGLPR